MRISVLKKAMLPVAAVFALGGIGARTLAVEQPVDGMDWTLSQEGDMAKLAYGLPNSDQLALMMTCAPGDTTAVVYGDVQPASARMVSDGPVLADPLSAGAALEATIALSDPALRTLQRTGRMNVEDEVGGYTLAADSDDRRIVGRFLSYCGAGRA